MERGCICTSPFPATRLNARTPAVVESLQEQAEARDAEGMEQAAQRIDTPPPITGLGTERILTTLARKRTSSASPGPCAKALVLFFLCCWGAIGAVAECRGEEMEQCGQRKRARQEPAGTGFMAVRLPRQNETITQTFGIRHPSSAEQKTEKQDTGSAATGAMVGWPRRGGLERAAWRSASRECRDRSGTHPRWWLGKI